MTRLLTVALGLTFILCANAQPASAGCSKGKCGSEEIGLEQIRRQRRNVLPVLPVLPQTDPVVVTAFGATGDGETDDTVAIQAAIDSLPEGGTVYFPFGTYRTTAPLGISANNLTLTGNATILSDHDGMAVGIVPTPRVFGLTISGNLTLRRPTRDVSAGSVGLMLHNCLQCVVKGISVINFNYGIYFLGDGGGAVYNLIEPRNMQNNHIQMFFATQNGGWANQNTIVGGRWWYSSGSAAPGGVHIYIDNNGYHNNGNLFQHVSLESGNPTYRAVVCGGARNTFVDVRTEGSKNWEFTGDSVMNTVFLGTYVRPQDFIDAGHQNTFLLNDWDGLVVNNNLRVGDAFTVKPTTDRSISLGSDSLEKSVGVFLPVEDGLQNTRGWLSLDPLERRFEWSHTWSSGGDLSYYLNRGRMVIANTGNVGIGTENPSTRLEVKGGDIGIETQGRGVILRATDSADCFRLTVNSQGSVETEPVDCP
jgi:hypothetical protein